jgi:hypothetical protein
MNSINISFMDQLISIEVVIKYVAFIRLSSASYKIIWILLTNVSPFIYSYPTYLYFIVLLSSHIFVGVPSGNFFPVKKILFHSSPLCLLQAPSIWPDLIMLTILRDEHNVSKLKYFRHSARVRYRVRLRNKDRCLGNSSMWQSDYVWFRIASRAIAFPHDRYSWSAFYTIFEWLWERKDKIVCDWQEVYHTLSLEM